MILVSALCLWLPLRAAAFTPATFAVTTEDIPRKAEQVKETGFDALLKAARVSFLNSFRAILNQVAYETATFIGSGGEGQVPVYYTEEFGAWIGKQGRNAAGGFIEEFARSYQNDPDTDPFLKEYDICAPDLSVGLKIGLGLTDFANVSQGIPESRCNLSTILKNNKDALSQLGDKDYLRNLGMTMFSPETTDLGVAYTLFGGIVDSENLEKLQSTLDREESDGWIPAKSGIANKQVEPPKNTEAKLNQARALQEDSFLVQSGDIALDAGQIFLNQFALSAFNKILSFLSSDKPEDGSSSIANFYSQGGGTGLSSVSRKANSILRARFNERADYDILSELSSCPNEARPGPSNCVITPEFSQAISRRLTIADAINTQVIDGSKRVGFDQNGNEMSYTEGYPYRSLLILRKYRILPVGWELAAQYIKDHPQETRDITLSDLLACYDPNDKTYPGAAPEWCRGLIDPNWVLKVPKMFCGMEGYGPEITSHVVTSSVKGFCAKSSVVNCSSLSQGTARQDCATNNVSCTKDEDCNDATFSKCNFTLGKESKITRNDTYCADEQSCIQENPNGTCAFYGYCTEEKRQWIFSTENDNVCEPRNNTCQVFSSEGNEPVAFLKNTLDYENCGAGEVGCKLYATDGAYNTATKAIAWSDEVGLRHFNKNIEDCDAGGEGCHEFIRTKDDLDTNLIADGSFENSVCATSGGSEAAAPASGERATNPFVRTAQAQVSLGDCLLEPFSQPGGYMAAPNGRWYIRVNSGSAKAGVVRDQFDHGGQSLYVEGAGGLYSRDSVAPSLFPAGFIMEGGRYYTLSVRVYVTDGAVRAGFGTQPGQFSESTSRNAWQTLIVTLYNPSSEPLRETFVEGVNGTSKFYIDSFKVSVGKSSTSYSDYFGNSAIYQKLLPAYLESACYVNPSTGGGRLDYAFKPDAPEECFAFARKCNATEVGCEAYTATASGMEVTGIAKPKDLCPQSCIGYDVFVRQADAFNIQRPAYFISSTARTCGAQSVGCTAFTNLDKLAGGAEAVEYYTDMRSCLKPDPTACAEFYSWEGSDESGYQLKVHSLKQNGSQPASTLAQQQEELLCNASIFKKAPDEPGYNFDCREFYGRDGSVSYHLYTKTISCSEDCHPYRREVASADECTAGGGSWDAAQKRCLHYAIPGEGSTCQAEEVGCGEYTGNIASNIQVISYDTFEDSANPTAGWEGGTSSSTSLNLGGRSLSGTSISKIVGSAVSRNKSYTVSFLAKAASGNVSITAMEFANDDDQLSQFSTSGASIGSEWKLYTFNLGNLSHDVSPVPGTGGGRDEGEKLRFAFSNPIFIDNIKLTEIPNRYYVIRDSWNTPEECDQDMAGGDAPRYMLGCSQYTKADSTQVNLRSFTQLCQDSAAGCEAMIDTHNSSDFKKKTANDTNSNGICDTGEDGCFETAADSMVNVVYDRSKQCGGELKGCQRAGVGSTYDSVTTFSDIYIKNDPDRYATTVCGPAAVGCSQWNGENGSVSYFKDPKNEVCEWRLKGTSTRNEYGWFKKKITRCGGSVTGTICSSNAQCGAGQACQLVSADIPCPVTEHKTIGRGSSRVLQPSEWAGTCEEAQSGCTEYIDPVSIANENLLKNPGCSLSSGSCAEPWVSEPGPSQAVSYQPVVLELNTLYIIKGSKDDNNVAGPSDEVFLADCRINSNPVVTGQIYQLGADNQFTLKASQTDMTKGDASLEVYIASPNTGDQAETATCRFWRKNQVYGRTDVLRKAIVDYQFAETVDRVTPNGLVNTAKSYVLFNERSQNGKAIEALKFNADKTAADEQPVDGTTPKTVPPPLNANVILKVQADRVCSKWLSCNTSIPDPSNPSRQTCLDVGLCDSLDSEGNCNHFITPPTQKDQTIASVSYGNLTGYSVVGYQKRLTVNGEPTDVGNSLMLDYYNVGNMAQVGDTATFNGGFEGPSGWSGSDIRSLMQPWELSRAGLTPIHQIKDSSSGESAYLVPVGRGIGELDAGKTTEQAVSLRAGNKYTLSAYLYAKTVGAAGIKVLWNGQAFTPTLAADGASLNAWSKKTINFTIPTGATNLRLQIFNSTTGSFYIDEISFDSGLNYRCSDPTADSKDCLDPLSANKKPQFLTPMCRLYPQEGSLSCREEDDSGVISKGIKGYCLQADPKNPDTCLLWYPVDKVSSEKNDDELALTIGDETDFVYYCTKAKDRCDLSVGGDPTKPELFCEEYIRVDKSRFWYDRLKPSSTFSLGSTGFFTPSVFYPEMKINLGRKYHVGNEQGTHGEIKFTSLGVDDNYFGALTQSNNPSSGNKVRTNAAGQLDLLNSFVPYWFSDYPYQFAAYDSVGTLSAWPAGGSNRTLCYDSDFHNTTPPTHPDELIKDHDSAFVLAFTEIGETGCTTSCTSEGCTGHDGCNIFNLPPRTYSRFTYYGPSGPEVRAGVWSNVPNSFYEPSIWATKGDSRYNYVHWTYANNIKNFTVAKTPAKAEEVIKRLFPGAIYGNDRIWTKYVWNPATQGYTVQNNYYTGGIGECPAAGRPTSYQEANNGDYCYVRPQVQNFKIKNMTGFVATTSQEEIIVTFDTKTDSNQLPIDDVTFDFGYRVGNSNRSINLYSGVGDNNPRQAKQIFSYSHIYENDPQKCAAAGQTVAGTQGQTCGARACCIIRPHIILTDNWGYYDDEPYASWLRVDQTAE